MGVKNGDDLDSNASRLHAEFQLKFEYCALFLVIFQVYIWHAYSFSFV